MKTGLRTLVDAEFGPRKALTVLLLMALAAGFLSTLVAIARPFWYDEICTVIMCRLPTIHELWGALDHAADSNPPLYYITGRISHIFIADEQVAYRLPSVIGLVVAVIALYFILARTVDRVSALAGAAFLLCSLLSTYAYEARPYAIMVACLTVAIFAWQRLDDSWLYYIGFAVALAAAVSLHYYAILAWPAFVVAEAVRWLFTRRFRPAAWGAMVIGGAALVVFAPLLLHFRQAFGRHFWARPYFAQILSTYSDLFNLVGYWGWCFTVVAGAVLLYWALPERFVLRSSAGRPRRTPKIPIEECALTLALLSLPVMGVVAAKVGGGGMTTRYILPAVLGGAMAAGYLTSAAPSSIRVLLLGVLMMNYGLSSIRDVKHFRTGWEHGTRAAITRDINEIIGSDETGRLPLVISSALDYFPLNYYAAPEARQRLYVLADPAGAMKFINTDSVDAELPILQRYFPLQIEPYDRFASEHREFMLISTGAGKSFDWWPRRLSQDGDRLTVVSTDGDLTIYRVTLAPQQAIATRSVTRD